jgi:hypothetical protein
MIGVPVKPSMILHGRVLSVTPRRAYDQATSRRTDEVIGYEVTLQQDNGAQAKLRYSLDDAQVSVGQFVAAMIDVQESVQYGAFAVFVRNVLTDDLDRLNSALSAPAKA